MRCRFLPALQDSPQGFDKTVYDRPVSVSPHEANAPDFARQISQPGTNLDPVFRPQTGAYARFVETLGNDQGGKRVKAIRFRHKWLQPERADFLYEITGGLFMPRPAGFQSLLEYLFKAF